MRDDKVQISPPLYIVHTVTSCWKCHEEMPVVALIAPHVIAPHFPEAEGTVCILSYIEELPEAVLHFLSKRFPSFQLTYSRTANLKYYANTCSKCGILSGDDYLHKPDTPFFPTTEEAAKELTAEAIPLGESITVRAELRVGVAERIIKHAKRLDA